MGSAYNIIGVQNTIPSKFYVFNRDWVDVMNYDSIVNIHAFDSKITAIITNNNAVPKMTPLFGEVETLIKISIKSKSLFSNNPVEAKILESFIESPETN
jgi:hypothetical protein